MANPLQDIGQVPLDKDNEAIIIVNAIKNTKHREKFARQVDYREFRFPEFITLAYAIKSIHKDKLEMDIDMLMLKSQTCPVRKYLDYGFIEELITNFNEVSDQNFDVHLAKLRTDSVKSSLVDLIFSSLHRSIVDPRTKLSDIEMRVEELSKILEKGYSALTLGFKSMEEVIGEYIDNRDKGINKRTTGFTLLDKLMTQGLMDKWISVIAGNASMGKTHGVDTPVIMFDGTIKMIQDVKAGDLLMGVDSSPRKVIRAWSGIDDMYLVKQTSGEDYTATGQHVLSLKRGTVKYCKPDWKLPREQRRITHQKGKVLNISIVDYLKKGNGWKKDWKGYKSYGWLLPEKKVKLSPYFLGLWLAGGSKNSVDITNSDFEVRGFLESYAADLNMHYGEFPKKGSLCPTCTVARVEGDRDNYLLSILREYDLLDNKHIPDDFKYNSRENRLQLLAGLLDGNGYLTHVTFEISTKYVKLKDDVLYLGRSLGFYCNAKLETKRIKSRDFKRKYWRIRIVGDIHLIPTKVKRKQAKRIERRKNPLYTGIDVEYLGKKTFYSISLDETSDQLYILGDGTVTHNSSFSLSMMNNLGNKGIHCPMFALEMPNMSIAHKLLAFNTNFAVKKVAVEWDNLTEQEQKIYEFEIKRLARNQYIYLNDKPTQTLPEMREQIMLLQDKLQTQYMVMFVDLFGKIQEFQGSDNFARDYEKHCNTVQIMTRELGIHTVLVAQIVKSVMNRKFKRPTMNDLKNSGALTEVADNIFGIYRPFYDPEVALKQQLAYGLESSDMIADPNANLAEILILKQRMGQVPQLLNFHFDPNTTRFSPIEEDYQDTINATKFEDDEEDY